MAGVEDAAATWNTAFMSDDPLLCASVSFKSANVGPAGTMPPGFSGNSWEK